MEYFAYTLYFECDRIFYILNLVIQYDVCVPLSKSLCRNIRTKKFIRKLNKRVTFIKSNLLSSLHLIKKVELFNVNLVIISLFIQLLPRRDWVTSSLSHTFIHTSSYLLIYLLSNLHLITLPFYLKSMLTSFPILSHFLHLYIYTFIPLYILFYFYFLHNYTTPLSYFYIYFLLCYITSLPFYTFYIFYIFPFFYSSSYLSYNISYLSFITIIPSTSAILSSFLIFILFSFSFQKFFKTFPFSLSKSSLHILANLSSLQTPSFLNLSLISHSETKCSILS